MIYRCLQHITLQKTFELSESVILAKQGHFLLKAIIHCLDESMGHTFVKNKWQESGLKLTQWMSEEQVSEIHYTKEQLFSMRSSTPFYYFYN